jgi:hypothetical protein
MLKIAAIIFGIVLLAVGVLGFVPAVAPNGMLLGIFHVNAAHNGVHLLTGAAALITGMMSTNAARMFFRVFGVVYALVAALGFYVGDGMLLGVISNNMADVWLHVAIAAASLALGFLVQDTSA